MNVPNWYVPHHPHLHGKLLWRFWVLQHCSICYLNFAGFVPEMMLNWNTSNYYGRRLRKSSSRRKECLFRHVNCQSRKEPNAFWRIWIQHCQAPRDAHNHGIFKEHRLLLPVLQFRVIHSSPRCLYTSGQSHRAVFQAVVLFVFVLR